VPLSTLPPSIIEPWHYAIPADKYSFFSAGTVVWVKANMLTHAGFPRLDRVLDRGKWSTPLLDPADFRAIIAAVLAAIDLARLIPLV
jgi:uncharacterized protein YifN (PemK superfamily)